MYHYPYHQKIDFHEQIDGKSDYVVIVRLKNEKIVAAYSKEALVKGVENNGDGFLAELSGKKSFYLKKNNAKAKISSWNEYFLIFGNAELRIKSGESQVYSNLGSTFKYFNTEKAKDPEVLFGTAER